MSSSSEAWATPVPTLPAREADALAAALDASDRKQFSKHCVRLARELAQSEPVTNLAACVYGKPGVLALTTERMLFVHKPDAITPMNAPAWSLSTLASADTAAPDQLVIRTDDDKLMRFKALNPPIGQTFAEQIWMLQGLVSEEPSTLLPSREAAALLAALDPSERAGFSTVCERLEGALTPTESVSHIAACGSSPRGLVALTNERMLCGGQSSEGRIRLTPIPFSAITSVRAVNPSVLQTAMNSSNLPDMSFKQMKPALAKAFVEQLSAHGVADPKAATEAQAASGLDQPSLGPPVFLKPIEQPELAANVSPPARRGTGTVASEGAKSPVSDSKTCPMCAEDVKAAAMICRFCGHRFGEVSPEQAPLPPKPDAPPPEALTRQLRTGEELFVWEDCYLYGASGSLGITSDRVLFASLDGTVADHAIDVGRKATVAAGVVAIEFGDGLWQFSQLHPATAKEIGASVAPGLIDKLFPADTEMQQRLYERHARIVGRAPALAPKVSATVKGCTVKGCKYLGGITSLGSMEISSVSLHFEPREIEIRTLRRTLCTVSEPKSDGVVIAGHEEMQQRLTATRILTLGVFSLAAPKGRRHATSYITLAIAGGEHGIFEVKDTDPVKLRARLSPWLAEH